MLCVDQIKVNNIRFDQEDVILYDFDVSFVLVYDL